MSEREGHSPSRWWRLKDRFVGFKGEVDNAGSVSFYPRPSMPEIEENPSYIKDEPNEVIVYEVNASQKVS